MLAHGLDLLAHKVDRFTAFAPLPIKLRLESRDLARPNHHGDELISFVLAENSASVQLSSLSHR